MSAQTGIEERKDSAKIVAGPLLCQQCRKLVRWVRVDGGVLLVNAGTGSKQVESSQPEL